MAVGAKQRVYTGQIVFHADHAGKKFKIELMTDARTWRRYPQPGEARFRPFEEVKTALVPLELNVQITRRRIGSAPMIDLDGMIDHEIGMEPNGLVALDAQILPGF